MNKLKFLLTFLPALLPLLAQGAPAGEMKFQAQAADWLERDYDFGLMKEVAGPKEGQSRFVNRADAPLVLVMVRPSCGCTSADYPTDPIEPGDTAVIRFTYDPAGRPGRFEKNINLTFSDGSKSQIHISGNVLGTPESLSQFYPVEVGPVRLSEDIVAVGDVEFGRAPTRFINAYNQRPDTVRPRMVSLDPSLTVSASGEAAGPGDVITYSLTFDSRACGLTGPVELPLEFYPDADATAPHEVAFRARVAAPPASLVPKDAAKAPKIFLTPDRLDLGNLVAGSTARFSFTILNQGKNPLEVRQVYSETPGVSFDKVPDKIKGGKSAAVEGRLDTSGMAPGPLRLTINIATNDPARPVTPLSLTAIIE